MTCLFCRIAAGELPSYTVYETPQVRAFLDISPTVPGHVLVIPKGHAEQMLDASWELMSPVFEAAHMLAPAVRAAAKADGLNVVINNGKAAGQVIFHPHVHLIPRHEGDGLEGWHGTPRETADLAQDARRILEALAPSSSAH
jgi:histidine triad (HIT) family protein